MSLYETHRVFVGIRVLVGLGGAAGGEGQGQGAFGQGGDRAHPRVVASQQARFAHGRRLAPWRPRVKF